MNIAPGDKVISIPTKTGMILIPVESVSPGDKVVSIPTKTGPVLVPLGTISPGDKVIAIPDSRGKYIIIRPGMACLRPVTDFSAEYTNLNLCNAIVTFTDLSTNSPTSWFWEFGDGGTSILQNPTHLYVMSGVFTVSLTATNACGSKKHTHLNYITIETSILPTFDWMNRSPFIVQEHWPTTSGVGAISALGYNGVRMEGARTLFLSEAQLTLAVQHFYFQPERCAQYIDLDLSMDTSYAPGWGSLLQIHGTRVSDGSAHGADFGNNPPPGHYRFNLGSLCKNLSMTAIFSLYAEIDSVSVSVSDITCSL